jgi:hypothetical protein
VRESPAKGANVNDPLPPTSNHDYQASKARMDEIDESRKYAIDFDPFNQRRYCVDFSSETILSMDG